MSRMVACDVDGVLANFTGPFHERFKLLTRVYTNVEVPSYPGHANIPEWAWWKTIHPRMNEETWQAINKSPNFWIGLPPLYDLAPVREVHREWPILFLTRRQSKGNNAWFQTVMWFEKFGILEPLVYCVREGEEKHEVCAKLGISIAIEDKPENIRDLAEAGIQTIVPCYAYNDMGTTRNVHPVADLAGAIEVAGYLRKELG